MFEPICRSHAVHDENLLVAATTMTTLRDCNEQVLDFGRSGLGRGHIRTFFEEGSMVNVVDMVVDRAIHSRIDAVEDLLLVRANIGSACSYTLAGEAPWRFVGPEVTVSFLPRGASIDIIVKPDTMHMAVTMFIRPRALMERYGLRREELPAPLLQAIDGELEHAARLFALPLDPGIAALVEDLMRSRLPERLRRLQVDARGMELLLLVATAWKERLEGGVQASLRERDAYLIASARRILTQRLVDPPTLQELAQELGTNRNKLNQIFQLAVGMTPKAFCVQRRIERAQVLLHEGRLNVAQIAETVGYQHQSSFTAAFRDVVGMCPRDFGNVRHARRVPELAAA